MGVLTILKRSNLLNVFCVSFASDRHRSRPGAKTKTINMCGWTHILQLTLTHTCGLAQVPEDVSYCCSTVSHHITTGLGFEQNNHVTIIRSLLCERPPPTQSDPSRLQHQTLPFDDFTSMCRWVSCTSSYLMSVIGVKHEHHCSSTS